MCSLYRNTIQIVFGGFIVLLLLVIWLVVAAVGHCLVVAAAGQSVDVDE